MKDKHPNRLKAAMEQADIGVSELARRLETSRQNVSRYVNGEYELNRAWAERFAPVLGVKPEMLIFDDEPAERTPRAEFKPPPELFVAKDLPVYGAAEGGPGEMVVSPGEVIDYTFRPEFLLHVKDAYALFVNGTSMEPRYEAGEKVYVHPRAPLVHNKDVILCSEVHGGDFKASIKRLIRWEQHQWYIKQYNPEREWWVSKKEWPKAYRVFGRIDF